MKTTIATLLVIMVALLIWQGLTSGNENDLVYQNTIKEERAQKDKFLRYNSKSPVPDSLRQNLNIQYFDIDASYKVEANLKVFDLKEIMTLPSTQGGERVYYKYAMLEFELDGKQLTGVLLQPVGENRFFFPFTDASNGQTTYGAGRYLEDVPVKKNKAVLDFNQASNPYCAYNPAYDCPMPPKDNHLDVSILSGEKLTH